MRKDWIPIITVAFGMAVLNCSTLQAQQPKAPPQEPRTQLEALQKQTGTVIVKGFSTIGTISGIGNISVDCMEVANLSTGKKHLGIVIEVKEGGRFEKSDRSFIDYDEIEPLLKGIDYISKVTPSVTKLKDFEAIYKTKGDVTVTSFSGTNGKLEAAVKSGYIVPATAYISMPMLSNLRATIVQAKEKLDSIK